MPEVKKRQLPEVVETKEEPEELKIIVGDKEYPIPRIKVKELRKLLKTVDVSNPDEMTESEGIDKTVEFFYLLLKAENPSIKKADLEDMPAFQLGLEFYTRVRMELMKVPLVSRGRAR